VTNPRSKSTRCNPLSISTSAIFDLATVFSAAATNLPETNRCARPRIEGAHTSGFTGFSQCLL
jgi:hypothetical protein